MAIDRPAVEYLYERGSRDGTSFRDSFGPDETNSVAKFFTDWDDRYNAVLAFLGYSAIERDASNAPVRLNRLTPLRHPDVASAVNGAGHLYATRVPTVTGHKFTTKRSSDQIPGAELNQFFRNEAEVAGRIYQLLGRDLAKKLKDRNIQEARFVQSGPRDG